MHAVHRHVGIAAAQQHLHLGTHAQVLENLVGVAEGQFGIAPGASAHFVERIVAVAHALGKVEQVVGQGEAHVGALFQLNGVIAVHSLEADGDDVQVDVGQKRVAALLESLQCLVCRDGGMQESGGLLGSGHLAVVGVLEEHVAYAQTALQVNIEVAQHGYGEIALLVAVGGVHVVTIHEVVGEVGRAHFLSHAAAGRCAECRGQHVSLK